MEYFVTRWLNSPFTATQQATITVTVSAVNHLEVLNLSGLKEPGALISVNSQTEPNIRYQVDPSGGVVELVRYGSVEK